MWLCIKMGRDYWLFSYGIGLINNSIIVYALASWMVLDTLWGVAIVVITAMLSALGFAFTTVAFGEYLSKRIIAKYRFEPLLIAQIIVVPIYLLTAYALISNLANLVPDTIGVVELYVLASIAPVLALLMLIYILSS